MTAKDELAALVADLDDAAAAVVLAFARWLLASGGVQVEQCISRAKADDIGTRMAEDERPRD